MACEGSEVLGIAGIEARDEKPKAGREFEWTDSRSCGESPAPSRSAYAAFKTARWWLLTGSMPGHGWWT